MHDTRTHTPRTTIFTADGLSTLPLCTTADGATALRFECAPGLYQFSLLLDAARFDWESLYQVLNVHQNVNERTGPWDFELATARPLVPSYWIHLDGRKLGLWYVQRISLRDLAEKRFRGRFSFDVREAGAHELTLTPYRDADVDWVAARLEPDPEDAFQQGLRAIHPPANLPVAAWTDPAFWAARRAALAGTHAQYRAPLRAVFDWVRTATGLNHDAIPFLVAAAHLDDQGDAIGKALTIVDDTLALAAWGRLAEDVYGHNGDIGCAMMLRNMAWALHMLAPHLGSERRQRLQERLVRQTGIFMTQLLLMRDYWGGSLLQDHGRRAVHDFGTAAMCLWGIVPEADHWVAYIVPRIARGLDTAPRDGFIPGSSYQRLDMYTDSVMWYRDALLSRAGMDILEHPSLREVPAFVNATTDEAAHGMTLAEYNDLAPFVGGGLFMERMAAKFRDPLAARGCRSLLQTPAADLQRSPYTSAAGFLWGFLAHDPATQAFAAPSRPSRDLRWYDDSGFVHHRDDASGAVLAVKCGPWLGYHAQRHATGPCDLMECQPAGGHFVLHLDGRTVLVSPDIGYRLQCRLRSCLLVDEQGQRGDVGYPMSIPSQPHRGERIEAVRWEPASGRGTIRLELAPAYPEALGVLHYTREFLLSPARRLVCRDHVVLAQPRALSWRFHFRKDAGARLDGAGGAVVGTTPPLGIRPAAAGLALKACIQDTQVVYSYSSAFNRFQHVRFETTHAVGTATVEFVMSW